MTQTYSIINRSLIPSISNWFRVFHPEAITVYAC